MTQGISDKPIPDDLNLIGGTLGIAKGGTGETLKADAFDALSPNTTKGDISVHNGTDNVRLPVGADTQVLTADSGEASGAKWAPAAIPIFGAGYEYAESEGLSVTTSTSFLNKLLLVTAALAAGDYRVSYSAEINQSSAANACVVQFTVAAVQINEVIIEPKDITNFYSVQAFRRMTLNGSQAINIDFRVEGIMTAGIRRARIEIWRVS